MFIPYPGSGCFSVQDPDPRSGGLNAPDSGSATLIYFSLLEERCQGVSDLRTFFLKRFTALKKNLPNPKKQLSFNLGMY